jgi:hypothetical protein
VCCNKDSSWRRDSWKYKWRQECKKLLKKASSVPVNDKVQLRDLLARRIVCCWISPDISTNYVTQYRCGNLISCISLAVLKSIITTSYSVTHKPFMLLTIIWDTAPGYSNKAHFWYVRFFSLYLRIIFENHIWVHRYGNDLPHYHLNLI